MAEILSLKADIEYTFPLDRYYLIDDNGHSWAKHSKGKNYLVGLDAFGAVIAGDILHVRARKVGTIVKQFKALGTVESNKWIGPILQPFSGTITAFNEKLHENPKLIHADPYNQGWIVEIEINEDTFRLEKEHELISSIGSREKLEKFIKTEFERFELL
ncbi:MAG: glycine cleavage system protein H [Candidatus Hodarchaeota archaeon]